MIRPHMALPGLLALAALAGCAHPAPNARADAAAGAACRQHAEQVFMTQDRGMLYRNDERDALAGGVVHQGPDTERLSQQYLYENVYNDCLNGQSGAVPGSSPTPAQPAQANPAAPSPRS